MENSRNSTTFSYFNVNCLSSVDLFKSETSRPNNNTPMYINKKSKPTGKSNTELYVNQLYHTVMDPRFPRREVVTYYYRPQCSFGGVVFSQASVILFKLGVYPGVHWGRHPPPPSSIPACNEVDTSLDSIPACTGVDTPKAVSQNALGWTTPIGQYPSMHRCRQPLGSIQACTGADSPLPPRQPLQKTVLILLECILV